LAEISLVEQRQQKTVTDAAPPERGHELGSNALKISFQVTENENSVGHFYETMAEPPSDGIYRAAVQLLVLTAFCSGHQTSTSSPASSPASMEWPAELLAEFARFLALDGHTAAFQRFAYLTTKSSEFESAVGKVLQPLVLHAGFDRQVKVKKVYDSVSSINCRQHQDRLGRWISRRHRQSGGLGDDSRAMQVPRHYPDVIACPHYPGDMGNKPSGTHKNQTAAASATSKPSDNPIVLRAICWGDYGTLKNFNKPFISFVFRRGRRFTFSMLLRAS
jgi:hypothetical protein